MTDRAATDRHTTDLARASILGAIARAFAPEHVPEIQALLDRHAAAKDPLTRERLWRTGLGLATRAAVRRFYA